MHSVVGNPLGEPAIQRAIVFRRELAAASPALVPHSPVPHAEWIAVAVGGSLVCQGRAAGRRVAVFDPLLELLGRTGAHVGRHVRFDVAQPAEMHELMQAEKVRLRVLPPAAETARALRAGTDSVAPMVFVRKAAARPADDDATQPPHVLDEGTANPVNVGDLRVGADPDAVVNDAAQMFGELAVEGGFNRARWLV